MYADVCHYCIGTQWYPWGPLRVENPFFKSSPLATRPFARREQLAGQSIAWIQRGGNVYHSGRVWEALLRQIARNFHWWDEVRAARVAWDGCVPKPAELDWEWKNANSKLGRSLGLRWRCNLSRFFNWCEWWADIILVLQRQCSWPQSQSWVSSCHPWELYRNLYDFGTYFYSLIFQVDRPVRASRHAYVWLYSDCRVHSPLAGGNRFRDCEEPGLVWF